MNRHQLASLLVPGCVFQSVMIGGGYGTGREIVQYFTQFGLWGGIAAIAVAGVAMSLFLAFLFEAARFFRAFDYRSLCRPLLGPLFPVFEVLNVLMLVLVLAVLGAATGQILAGELGWPEWLGMPVLLVPIALLIWLGRESVTLVLAWSAAYLYLVFVVFLMLALRANTLGLGELAALEGSGGSWARSGLQFAMYNGIAAPFVLYSARSLETRAAAIGAGVVAGFLAMSPALLFHIALVTRFEESVAAALPVYEMIHVLNLDLFLVFYIVMLLVTFVDTGAGLLQGLSDRIDAYVVDWRGRPLTRRARTGIAVAAVLASTTLSGVGIKDLIGRGYGTIAWAYLGVLVLPLLVSGSMRMRAATR